MCIAILNSKSTLSKSHISNSWENNDQGAGLMWVESGKVMSFKSFNKDTYTKEYYKLRKKHKGVIVLHFRIATSGKHNTDNLHPFISPDKDYGLVHNGVFYGFGDKNYSDTHEVAGLIWSEIKDPMNSVFINNLCEENHSKIIMLDKNGDFTIYNESMGHWVGDNWFSNSSYAQVNDYVWAGSKKVARSLSSQPSTQTSSKLFDDPFFDEEDEDEEFANYQYCVGLIEDKWGKGTCDNLDEWEVYEYAQAILDEEWDSKNWK